MKKTDDNKFDVNCKRFVKCLKKHKIIGNENEYLKMLQVGDITLPIKEFDNAIPSGLENYSARIVFNIKEKTSKEKASDFPFFVKYEFLIIFSGYDSCNKTEYICSWHLDYDESGGNEIYHPLFHLTYGGTVMRSLYEFLGREGFKEIKKSASVCGQIEKDDNDVLKVVDDQSSPINTALFPLLLPAPRLPFHPMDIFLGVDFLMCTFLKKKEYDILQNDSEYKCIIKESQNKFWKPYYSAISANWPKNSCFPKVETRLLNQTLINAV